MKVLKIAVALLVLVLSSGAAFAAEFVLKAASVQSDSYPPQKAFFEFKEYVEKNSRGRIEVVKYADSQLGNTNETIEALQMGVVQMTFPALADLAMLDKRLQVMDLPFLFPDYATAHKALHGDLGKKIQPILDGLGFRAKWFTSNGVRSVSNNKKPIYVPADLKGLKIRTMQNQMHIAVFKAFGANPTPISYSELYTALQQGVVDGQENAALSMVDVKLQFVQKYYSLTRHLVSIICPIMNTKWYESLPPDLQKVVDDGMVIFEKKYTEYFEKAEISALEEMKKAGVKINDLTPAQRKEFEVIAQKVYKDAEKTVGKDLIDAAIASSRKYSK